MPEGQHFQRTEGLMKALRGKFKKKPGLAPTKDEFSNA